MTQISNKDELRRMIARYVRGEASREEVVFLQKYFDHFDERSTGIEEMNEKEREKLKNEMMGFLTSQIGSGKPKSYFKFSKVAAVLVFVIIGASILWWNPFNVSIEINNGQIPGQPTRTVTYTYEAEDEPLHHYLPDGSYVVLEPGSRITYDPDFRPTSREVNLEGDAFFDIRHEADRPFIVQSSGLTTKVLGTAFRISTDSQNNEFSVAVTRGKVAVSDQDHEFAVLEMNDQMVLDMDTYRVTKTTLKESEKTKLEPERYMMDDISVGDALKIISLRWDCEFKVVNRALYNCEFTTSFLPTDSLEEIVAVISAVIGAQYGIEGNLVTMTGAGCED